MAFRVGDRVVSASYYGKQLTKGKAYEIVGISGDGLYYRVVDNLGNTDGWPEGQRGPAGPVRTVTRREIVDGTYGPVIVSGIVNIPDCTDPDAPAKKAVQIDVNGALSATELDSLAMVASQLAEALREQG